MRVVTQGEEPKKDSKYIPNGTYRAKVSRVDESKREKEEEVNGKMKKPFYALRLSFDFVSPKYKEFQKPGGMLWFEYDENGPFIMVGKPAYNWLTKLTGVKDFSDWTVESFKNNLKGKECLVNVKTIDTFGRNGQPKKATNVVDIFSIPKEDKSKPVVEQKPAPVAEVKQPVPVAVAAPQKDEFTDEADIESSTNSDDDF